MSAEPDLARIARTIGDPTRLRMLTLLLEGRAFTAKELAYGAGVEPATGSAHLRRLVDDDLVVVRAQGRHRYFRLTSPRVARCIESLLVVAVPAPTSAKPVCTKHPLHRARFCYDHLAGSLAIEFTDYLVRKRLVVLRDGAFVPTAAGCRWFTALGVDVAALAASRRQFAPACMDWSERRDHIGGALGAALAQRLLELRWIKRASDSRAVTVTPFGKAALAERLGLAWQS